MAKVEIFSAGCPCCDEAIQAVKAAAGSSQVVVRDMKDPKNAADAKGYGIKRVPAVVVDGKLAGCCAKGGIDLAVLRSAGLGT